MRGAISRSSTRVDAAPSSDGSAVGGAHALYGHVGRDVSYGWQNPVGGTMSRVLMESGMLIADRGDTVQLDACAETTVPMVRLLVTGGGAESLLAAARRARGEAEPAATSFDVTVEGGADASAAVVHVTDAAGGYVTSVTADGAGERDAGLPEGSYLATAVLDGHAPVADVPFTVGASGGSVALAVPEAATLSYSVLDGDGLLSFREGPAFINALRGLKKQADIIIFDGQGIAHPKRLGIASHIGVLLNVPTIGCAKSRLVGFIKNHVLRKVVGLL